MLATRTSDPRYAGDVDAEGIDALLICRMRMLLASAVLLGLFIDPDLLYRARGYVWLIFAGYFIHSAVLYFCTRLERPFTFTRIVHWLDVAWYGVIIASTGGIASVFFIFFFFAILTASFRWGAEEGAQITIASGALFGLCALLPGTVVEPVRLLLRATFLLAFGYMIVHWGAANHELNARLRLLRDVSRPFNPRFGVERSVASLLEETRGFFAARSCALILHDPESGQYTLTSIREGQAEKRFLPPSGAEPLLALPADAVVWFAHRGWRSKWPRSRARQYCRVRECWERADAVACRRVADLLDTQSFASAPVRLNRCAGRLYACADGQAIGKADALFLEQLGRHAMLAIENLALLDHIVTDAASDERFRIGLDLHDSTIQPYIGLRMGLMALRNGAHESNPLNAEIERLIALTNRTIEDLRSYAGALREKMGISSGGQALKHLRQQAVRAAEQYGIEMALHIDEDLHLSDRMLAEVVQIVREGLSNMARHARADRARIGVLSRDGWLQIAMANATPEGAAPFTPKSISWRAQALGGSVRVESAPQAETVVHVDIPM